jgi:hypothetical protein
MERYRCRAVRLRTQIIKLKCLTGASKTSIKNQARYIPPSNIRKYKITNKRLKLGRAASGGLTWYNSPEGLDWVELLSSGIFRRAILPAQKYTPSIMLLMRQKTIKLIKDFMRNSPDCLECG